MLHLPNVTLLALFIPTFFVVSITPGMCMTLSMTLGMTIGVRRTLWMMLGELTGVAIIATFSVVGVSALLLEHPSLFLAFKVIGGGYLAYLGIQLWLSRGAMAINLESREKGPKDKSSLIMQGFLTAVSNPKGWAFFIALLPPFIDHQHPLTVQVSALVSIIVVLEFICLLIYASGGKALARIFNQDHHLKGLNRTAGALMIGVAIWLVLS